MQESCSFLSWIISFHVMGRGAEGGGAVCAICKRLEFRVESVAARRHCGDITLSAVWLETIWTFLLGLLWSQLVHFKAFGYLWDFLLLYISNIIWDILWNFACWAFYGSESCLDWSRSGHGIVILSSGLILILEHQGEFLGICAVHFGLLCHEVVFLLIFEYGLQLKGTIGICSISGGTRATDSGQRSLFGEQALFFGSIDRNSSNDSAAHFCKHALILSRSCRAYWSSWLQ